MKYSDAEKVDSAVLALDGQWDLPAHGAIAVIYEKGPVVRVWYDADVVPEDVEALHRWWEAVAEHVRDPQGVPVPPGFIDSEEVETGA